jgi:hypothetical protein
LGEVLSLNKAEKWMRRAIDGLERTGERRDSLEIIGSEYRLTLVVIGLLIRDRNGHSVGDAGSTAT